MHPMTREGIATIPPHDKQACQKIAEALWAAATSENRNIAWGRGTVYRALELALEDALFHVYDIGGRTADHVRDLLSELGPNDGAYGTGNLWGVESYVLFAIENPDEYHG